MLLIFGDVDELRAPRYAVILCTLECAPRMISLGARDNQILELPRTVQRMLLNPLSRTINFASHCLFSVNELDYFFFYFIFFCMLLSYCIKTDVREYACWCCLGTKINS